MEETKKREYPQEMLLMGGCPNCGQEVNRQFVEKTIDEIVSLAVSKERERRDAQIIEFINSGEPAPWNDTGWSVELSDVEKFIKNTK